MVGTGRADGRVGRMDASSVNIEVTQSGAVILTWISEDGETVELSVAMSARAARQLGEKLFEAGTFAAAAGDGPDEVEGDA